MVKFPTLGDMYHKKKKIKKNTASIVTSDLLILSIGLNKFLV